MSLQLFKEDVLFYQRFLKVNGFYNEELDGVWGAFTDKADEEFLAASESIAQEHGQFDQRSEKNIRTLAPKAQIEARKFLNLTNSDDDNNQIVRIISGTRTFAEQDEIFAQGRTKPGKKVTNARGGQSNHNFGIAWDIGIFISGNYIEGDEEYVTLATNVILPQMTTIEWGGNFHSLKDSPHYQLKVITDDVAKILELFQEGESFYV